MDFLILMAVNPMPPLQGLSKPILYPGFRRPLPRAPAPWALVFRAFGTGRA